VTEELQKHGFEVWSDERGLSPGEGLAASTKSALASSDAIIAILSKHSYSSSWVREELEQALFNEKFKGKFLPVMIGSESEDFSRLPWVLSKINHLRLSSSEPRSTLGKKIVSAYLKHINSGA
jgi:TIR domain